MAKKVKQMEVTVAGKETTVYVQRETEDFYFVSVSKSGEKQFPVKKEPMREE